MSSRSAFSLHVVRCPACQARLPVRGKEDVVTCEYCDARVELIRRTASPTPSSAAPMQVTRAHDSGLPWVVVAIVALVGIAGSVAWVARARVLDSAAAGSPDSSVDANAFPLAAPVTPEPIRVGAASEASSEAEVEAEPEIDAEPDAKAKRPSARPSKAPPRSTGPVLTVAEARAALAPKVLACMQETKTHALLAYMGNTTAGPVKVLPRSTTRVDGRLSKLAGTKLGQCMNEAGKSVRTRAVSSNYVRFELRNAAVPDPLAGLPAQADRQAVAALIKAADPGVHACASKHGQEGAREVFYFKIDGPTGKALSVRGSYGSAAFRRCAEPLYRALAFPKVQQAELSITHPVQL